MLGLCIDLDLNIQHKYDIKLDLDNDLEIFPELVIVYGLEVNVELTFIMILTLTLRMTSVMLLTLLFNLTVHVYFCADVAYLSREARLSTHADSAYEMSTIAYHQILESAGVDTSRQ